jgi:hypothetical protein
MFMEGPLQRMQFPVLGQTLDGGDLLPLGIYGQSEAGADRLAVQQDGTGSALAHVAASLRARQAQPFPQGLQKGHLGLHYHVSHLAVHPQFD